MAYEYRKKVKVWKIWKLKTAQRMFENLGRYDLRGKLFFEWSLRTKNVIDDRKNGLLSRFFGTWKNALIESQLGHRKFLLHRRKMTKILHKWQSSIKEDGVMTNASRKRHFLAFWRQKYTSRIGTKRPIFTFKFDRSTLLFDAPPPSMQPRNDPLNNAEFMV